MKNPTIKSNSTIEKIGKSKWIKYSFLALICFITLSILVWFVVSNLKIRLSTGTIEITDIVLTTGLDSQGKPLQYESRFSTAQARIYCVIFISSPKPVNVIVWWYFQDQLIFEDAAVVNQWRAFYIEPLQGMEFPEGDYRVEISLVNIPVRVVYFSVVP